MRRLHPAALVASAALLAVAPAVGAQQAARDSAAVPIGSAPLIAPKGATLRAAPDAAAEATVLPSATLTPIARERGWVRVRLEGWVPERDLVLADSSLRAPLSAADLRADPAGTRGKVVRWDVEVLSLQTADPLRRDFAADEPYLLSRGPARENAIVYLAVPPSLLASARAIASRPLSRATVTARVRNGRSEPVGVPILDLLSISRD